MKTPITITLLIFTLCLAKSQDLRVEISTPKTIFKINKKLPLIVKLTNTSEEPIKIPQGMSATSNLLPNGLEDNRAAVNIEFELEGIEEVAMLIENLTYHIPTKYLTLKANESINYSYDLSKHFKQVKTLLTKEYKNFPLKIRATLTINYEENGTMKPFYRNVRSESISILFTR